MGPEGMRYAKAYAAAMQATFTPAWQAKLDQIKKTADAAKKSDAGNPPAFEEFGRFGGCGWTPGFPATMLPGTYEWRVTPEETTLISLLGSVRHIYTDGRPHPPKDELWPMSQGDSIGHWEGDTLVVDTVSVRSPVYLPGLARGTGVPALPMSNELHSIERIRMVSQDEMQIQFTVEDPIALAKPINVTLTWERVRDATRMEENGDDCDPSTDRNPIVNGRYTTIVKPASATPAEPEIGCGRMHYDRGTIVIATLLLAGCLHFAEAQTSSKARIEAFAKLPDWSGLWEFNIWTDELDGQQMGPEGMRYAKGYAAAMQATFTPAWQAKLDQLKKTADAAKKSDAANPPAFEEFGRFGGCGWTPGFPATMLPGTYEWRVTPEETTLISLLGSVRHIYTDGRPHPPKDELWPMSQGDSIGHWEGDTLVVDMSR